LRNPLSKKDKTTTSDNSRANQHVHLAHFDKNQAGKSIKIPSKEKQVAEINERGIRVTVQNGVVRMRKLKMKLLCFLFQIFKTRILRKRDYLQRDDDDDAVGLGPI